ncbi:Bud3p SCDLUD_003478 [Saccharomycodes ludwigii]|uniref:Bud3p n=1 Tax=Saccharomycodes ludwigii TaxID=36035 RepID=UPI001E88CAD7|nr:hypothetical protein SCDLUD_003478 [Saccharomycodes ludwigii]KAH3900493.1 hypothetical protein SCDLUD_003478 [Saccharomycodes ludwigii]
MPTQMQNNLQYDKNINFKSSTTDYGNMDASSIYSGLEEASAPMLISASNNESHNPKTFPPIVLKSNLLGLLAPSTLLFPLEQKISDEYQLDSLVPASMLHNKEKFMNNLEYYIFKDCCFLKGYESRVFENFIAIIFNTTHKPDGFCCILFDKFGSTYHSNIDLSSKSQYYEAIQNLSPDARDNIKKSAVVSLLQKYAFFSKKYPSFFNDNKINFDPTDAGIAINKSTLINTNTFLSPLKLGQLMCDNGCFHPRQLKSLLLDVVYENNTKAIDDNNKLVFHLGEQLEQLFNPLTEYSPEQTENVYKPPLVQELIIDVHDTDLINSIINEFVTLQTNFTVDLITFLQKFLIPTRVLVAKNEIKGLSLSKLNRVFPPTIDEVTRINCIFLDALKLASTFGSLEVLKACSITIPYFYKAYTRHEAATKKFHKDVKVFLQRYNTKIPNKDIYTEMKLETIIKGPQEKLLKFKLIIDRLWKEKKWDTEFLKREASLYYENVVRVIDTFGRISRPASYKNRVFTPSGKILAELADLWPVELQYKWLKRRVVGIFDVLDVNSMDRRSVIIVFSDYVVFLDVIDGDSYYNDNIDTNTNTNLLIGSKPLLSDILMNSLLNEMELPNNIPRLKVANYCNIKDVIVTSLNYNVLRFDIIKQNTHLSYKLVSPNDTTQKICDIITKASILCKNTAFHLFKKDFPTNIKSGRYDDEVVHDSADASGVRIQTYVTAHEAEAYAKEKVKSRFAIFLNIPCHKKILQKYNVYLGFFATLTDDDYVNLEVLSENDIYTTFKCPVTEYSEVVMKYLITDILPNYYYSLQSPFLESILTINGNFIEKVRNPLKTFWLSRRDEGKDERIVSTGDTFLHESSTDSASYFGPELINRSNSSTTTPETPTFDENKSAKQNPSQKIIPEKIKKTKSPVGSPINLPKINKVPLVKKVETEKFNLKPSSKNTNNGLRNLTSNSGSSIATKKSTKRFSGLLSLLSGKSNELSSKNNLTSKKQRRKSLGNSLFFHNASENLSFRRNSNGSRKSTASFSTNSSMISGTRHISRKENDGGEKSRSKRSFSGLSFGKNKDKSSIIGVDDSNNARISSVVRNDDYKKMQNTSEVSTSQPSPLPDIVVQTANTENKSDNIPKSFVSDDDLTNKIVVPTDIDNVLDKTEVGNITDRALNRDSRISPEEVDVDKQLDFKNTSVKRHPEQQKQSHVSTLPSTTDKPTTNKQLPKVSAQISSIITEPIKPLSFETPMVKKGEGEVANTTIESNNYANGTLLPANFGSNTVENKNQKNIVNELNTKIKHLNAENKPILANTFSSSSSSSLSSSPVNRNSKTGKNIVLPKLPPILKEGDKKDAVQLPEKHKSNADGFQVAEGTHVHKNQPNGASFAPVLIGADKPINEQAKLNVVENKDFSSVAEPENINNVSKLPNSTSTNTISNFKLSKSTSYRDLFEGMNMVLDNKDKKNNWTVLSDENDDSFREYKTNNSAKLTLSNDKIIMKNDEKKHEFTKFAPKQRGTPNIFARYYEEVEEEVTQPELAEEEQEEEAIEKNNILHADSENAGIIVNNKQTFPVIKTHEKENSQRDLDSLPGYSSESNYLDNIAEIALKKKLITSNNHKSNTIDISATGSPSRKLAGSEEIPRFPSSFLNLKDEITKNMDQLSSFNQTFENSPLKNKTSKSRSINKSSRIADNLHVPKLVTTTNKKFKVVNKDLSSARPSQSHSLSAVKNEQEQMSKQKHIPLIKIEPTETKTFTVKTEQDVAFEPTLQKNEISLSSATQQSAIDMDVRAPKLESGDERLPNLKQDNVNDSAVGVNNREEQEGNEYTDKSTLSKISHANITTVIADSKIEQTESGHNVKIEETDKGCYPKEEAYYDKNDDDDDDDADANDLYDDSKNFSNTSNIKRDVSSPNLRKQLMMGFGENNIDALIKADEADTNAIGALSHSEVSSFYYSPSKPMKNDRLMEFPHDISSSFNITQHKSPNIDNKDVSLQTPSSLSASITVQDLGSGTNTVKGEEEEKNIKEEEQRILEEEKHMEEVEKKILEEEKRIEEAEKKIKEEEKEIEGEEKNINKGNKGQSEQEQGINGTKRISLTEDIKNGFNQYENGKIKPEQSALLDDDDDFDFSSFEVSFTKKKSNEHSSMNNSNSNITTGDHNNKSFENPLVSQYQLKEYSTNKKYKTDWVSPSELDLYDISQRSDSVNNIENTNNNVNINEVRHKNGKLNMPRDSSNNFFSRDDSFSYLGDYL